MFPWRIKLHAGANTANYHGPDGATKRGGFSVVKLGLATGRGWRFIRYWKDGSWWMVDVCIVRKVKP